MTVIVRIRRIGKVRQFAIVLPKCNSCMNWAFSKFGAAASPVFHGYCLDYPFLYLLYWINFHSTCSSNFRQGPIQSWILGALNCLFHVKNFLALLFAIGKIAVWGPWPPGSAPGSRVYPGVQQNVLLPASAAFLPVPACTNKLTDSFFQLHCKIDI